MTDLMKSDLLAMARNRLIDRDIAMANARSQKASLYPDARQLRGYVFQARERNRDARRIVARVAREG